MSTGPGVQIANPHTEGIALEIGFENANPSLPELVAVSPEGVYQVRQYIEPGAPAGYSFALHVAVINSGGTTQTVGMQIDWQEKQFDYCRIYMYVGYDSGQRWQMLSVSSHDGLTELELVVPPGRHLLCNMPKFDGGDSVALLNKYRDTPGCQVMKVATSEQGRAIECLRCGSGGGRKVLVTTRAHGYETAGAYCLAGWLESLAHRPADCADVLAACDIYLFPMINPDAVAAGDCCLAPGGVNFGDGLAGAKLADRGARELVEFVLDLKPEVYLDMHNYMHSPTVDSFRCSDQGCLERFGAVAPDNSGQEKTWDFSLRHFAEGYLYTLCSDRWGTIGVQTEFPWYLRLPADMKDHGRRFLNAFLSVCRDC